MDFRVSNMGNIVDELLTKSLSQSQRVDNNLLQQTQDIIGNYNDTLSISALSQKVNELYEGLKREGSNEALLGFRDMMFELMNDPNNTDTLNFVNTIDRLSKGEGNMYTEVFETVYELGEEGLNIRNWFANMSEQDISQIEDYLSITNQIMSDIDEDLRIDLLDKFVSTVALVNKNDNISDEEKENLINQLYSGLRENNSFEDISDYLDNFRKENL